jgi:hypothetical protein
LQSHVERAPPPAAVDVALVVAVDFAFVDVDFAFVVAVDFALVVAVDFAFLVAVDVAFVDVAYPASLLKPTNPSQNDPNARSGSRC